MSPRPGTWPSILWGARWLFLSLAVLAGVIALTITWQSRTVNALVGEVLAEQAQAEAGIVAAILATDPQALDQARSRLPGSRRLTVIGPDGQVLFDSQADIRHLDNHGHRPEVVQARSHGTGLSRRHSDSTGKDLMYAGHLLPDGRVVRLALPIAYESNLEARLQQPMTLAGLAVVLLGSLVLILHLWRDRNRVHGLVEVARAYALGDFTPQVARSGGDALALLGQELNAMGSQLAAQRRAIEASRAVLEGALGALHEGVAVVDDLDQVIYANPAWRQFAAGGNEVVGQPYYHHVPVLDHSCPATPGLAELSLQHRRRHLRAQVVPAGPGTRVLVLHDVTEVTRLESARRDFIAAVSHELKTPLTAIVGFTDTLLSGTFEQDPAIARDFLQRLQRQAERLSTLVRDVLSLSRLEQGAWDIQWQECDLSRLVRTVIDEFQAEAVRHQVTLSLADHPIPTVTTDPELVRQLLGNLVSNGIRYNRPSGRVTVSLEATADQWTMAVRDTGIGIPAEHRQRIFERFYRVDSHRSRATGGTGLGLAIVRQLVEILHGTIDLDSGPDGSVFTVTMPIAGGITVTLPASARLEGHTRTAGNSADCRDGGGKAGD